VACGYDDEERRCVWGTVSLENTPFELSGARVRGEPNDADAFAPGLCYVRLMLGVYGDGISYALMMALGATSLS
jgi:hypothetical protein